MVRDGGFCGKVGTGLRWVEHGVGMEELLKEEEDGKGFGS